MSMLLSQFIPSFPSPAVSTKSSRNRDADVEEGLEKYISNWNYPIERTLNTIANSKSLSYKMKSAKEHRYIDKLS